MGRSEGEAVLLCYASAPDVGDEVGEGIRILAWDININMYNLEIRVH
jgi:hypothetical protein